MNKWHKEYDKNIESLDNSGINSALYWQGYAFFLEQKLKERDWISVNERLPGKFDMVLVKCINTVPCVGNYCIGKGWNVSGRLDIKNDLLHGVTHWMPLPQDFEEK